MKIVNIIVLSFCFYNLSFSQKSDTGNWLIYFGNQKINEKWNWHNEVQYRNYNFIGDTNQLLLRTGIGYNFTENNNNLLLGYGFINTQRYTSNSDQKTDLNEHRIYQQFITRQNTGSVFVQHRYRIEERFIADDFQMRFRYFLGINIPINKKTLEKNAIYLSAYNEIFINAEKPLFDRNRLYGALGFVINKDFKVEAGFMAQTLENSNRNQFQIVIFNNLPL
ncbi:DUF2490 domain-containing protein [Flavobacterium sp.]|uniref:DUF2490 domain-containing protein n=1 Tax=Flavobacterium sp. TaxID=239 RepID=UPI00286E8645|nr:DUF2490 domain-containing protein [Flavobacterium sp.]